MWFLFILLFSLLPVNVPGLSLQLNGQILCSNNSAARPEPGQRGTRVIPSLAACAFGELRCGFVSINAPRPVKLYGSSTTTIVAVKTAAADAKYNAPSLKAQLLPPQRPSVPITRTGSEQRRATAPDSGFPGATGPSGGEICASWEAIPITSLRTACRKLQLPSKGKRDELVRRLQGQVPIERVFALLQATGEPGKNPQAQEDLEGSPEGPSNTAVTPKNNKCHVCNSRLSTSK